MRNAIIETIINDIPLDKYSRKLFNKWIPEFLGIENEYDIDVCQSDSWPGHEFYFVNNRLVLQKFIINSEFPYSKDTGIMTCMYLSDGIDSKFNDEYDIFHTALRQKLRCEIGTVYTSRSTRYTRMHYTEKNEIFKFKTIRKIHVN